MIGPAATTSLTSPLHVPQQPTSNKNGSTQTIKYKKKMKKKAYHLFLGMGLLAILTSLYLLAVTIMMMTMFEPQPSHQSKLRNLVNNNKNADLPQPQQHHPRKPDVTRPPPSPPPRELLSSIQHGCVATADVVGNLGPPSTVLADADDNTDWLKHRWQTASNLHGTAIPGTHWLQLTWPHIVELHSVVLHWETAYADRYAIQIWDDRPNANNNNNSSNQNHWTTVLEAPQAIVQTTKSGHSPGVPASVQDAPLHVIQTLSEFLPEQAPATTALRIWMEYPGVHKGWGLSLWEVQVFGKLVVGEALIPNVNITTN